MKLPNHGNWQAEDHDVSKERKGAVDGTADSLILAMAIFYCLVIVISNWCTNCEVDEKRRNSPADSINHVGPGEHSELPRWEETHVEE